MSKQPGARPTPPDEHAGATQRTPAEQQRLRVLRFAAASATYAIGISILALCAALGMLSWARWGLIAAAFAAINLAFLLVFLRRANLAFADPSLTQGQVIVACSMMVPILLAGPRLDLVAVPFYSVLFVFAMLKLSSRQLVWTTAYMLATYALAVALRLHCYAGVLDLGDETVTAVLVVASAIWFAGAASYIYRLRSRLKETVARLGEIAARDGLTGLWSRRHIDALLLKEIQRAARSGAPLAVALADLDHFKSVNDRFGHAAGDAALQYASRAIGTSLRGGDELGRWGGEEFLILLPNANAEQARACANRLREALAAQPFDAATQARLTVSVGLAVWTPGEGVAELVARADRAMYRAKQAGRNRVEVDGEGSG
ncbi:MAG: GGDEF domain-containing protein [Pelomonas sp.]|nr:GGDEF domain-containing protein [Roseateles sp.]